MFHAPLIIMSRKYFFDFRSSRLPFDIRFWTRGFPLKMRSQKGGLPFATRARKRDLCLQRYVSRMTRTSGRPGSKFSPGRDRAGMTFIPAGTGIEMKTRPGPGLASSRPGPGPGFFQYFSISVKMKQCYMLNKIFQNKLRYVKLKLTVSSSNYSISLLSLSLSISLYLSLSLSISLYLSISLSISLFISEIESASALIGGSNSGFDICRTTVFSGRKHG